MIRYVIFLIGSAAQAATVYGQVEHFFVSCDTQSFCDPKIPSGNQVLDSSQTPLQPFSLRNDVDSVAPSGPAYGYEYHSQAFVGSDYGELFMMRGYVRTEIRNGIQGTYLKEWEPGSLLLYPATFATVWIRDTFLIRGSSGPGRAGVGLSMSGVQQDGGSLQSVARAVAGSSQNQYGGTFRTGSCPRLPCDLSIDVDFIYDQPFYLTLALQLIVYANEPGMPDGERYSGVALADFTHTMGLSSLSVLDSQGNPIPGTQIHSDLGLFGFPSLPVSQVPEPASAVMIAGALAGVMMRRAVRALARHGRN